MTQKVIERDNDTCQHTYAFDFEMVRNSNNFCLESNFSSNFEQSQNFRTKNMEGQIALELSCSSNHGAVLPGVGWRFSYRELASPGIPSFERVT